MKITEVITLIAQGNFVDSAEWLSVRKDIHAAIRLAEWPVGSGTFTIHPKVKGNGVVPIKALPMAQLKRRGWKLEHKWIITNESDLSSELEGKSRKGSRAGNIDAAKELKEGLAVVEWETGNISSSHRAINKMALGLVHQKCVAGVLVVPRFKLSRYLTDRIGNIEELRPYFPMWRAVNVKRGVLELVVIEQDAESVDVPLIGKNTSGRAKEAAAKARKLARAAARRRR